MIKKEAELIKKHYENIRDGKLHVDAVCFLNAEDSYGAGSFFGKATIPPGGSIGYHQHKGETEIYYILKGKAKVFDNDMEHILEAGDMMQCKDGDGHGIENVGDCDLEFLAIILNNCIAK